MIRTLSWAPLKNSGFRSIGISSVALLLMSDRGAVKGSRFRGNRVAGDRTAASRPQSDVTKTSKYSRFRANKKRTGLFQCYLLFKRGLPWKAGRRKIEELDPLHRGETHETVRLP